MVARDHNPLFTKFWEELRSGKGVEKGEADVETLVEAYTNVKTLTPLSKEEMEKIKEHLRLFFRIEINTYNTDYNTLINDEICLVDSRDINFDMFHGGYSVRKNTLLNISHLAREERYWKMIQELKTKGIKALTLEEKVRLFSDPTFLKKTQYYTWEPILSRVAATGFGSGSRRLTEQSGGYYHSNEQFLEEVQAIRGRTGKPMLRILDVGSNFGFALKDMKDLDPNIETFNMTIDEHPSLFGDHIVRHPAEMMPAEFEEIMDLIASQVAFRYFLYSDIALRNVIKSLAVGGVARISYQVGDTIHSFPPPYSRIELDEEEVRNRQRALWASIKTLVDQGYLDISGSSSQIKEGILNPGKDFPEGFVMLTKNKSTKSVAF